MGLLARTLPVALLLVLAGPAAATVPLPPTAVTANPTAAGIEVAWMPPAYDGGAAVESYVVYRLDGLTWTAIGTTLAPVTTLLDPTPDSAAIYRVEAVNAAGNSPPSLPSTEDHTLPHIFRCEVLVIVVDLDFPFVHPIVNKDCVGTVLWVNS